MKAKKPLALLLALLMVLGVFFAAPFSAYADVFTYTVAGSYAEMFGSAWDAWNNDNNMTFNAETGRYEITYKDVSPENNIMFKIAKDHSWDVAYPEDEAFMFDVKSTCDVTISFDPETKEINVTGDGVLTDWELEAYSVIAYGNGEENYLHGVNWDPTDTSNAMTRVADGIWEITMRGINAFDNYIIRFAVNSVDDAGNPTSDPQEYTFGSEVEQLYPVNVEFDAVYNGKNCIFEVEDDGSTVTLRLDLRNFDSKTKTGAKMMIKVAGPGEEPTEEPTVAPTVAPTVEPTEPAPTADALTVNATSNLFTPAQATYRSSEQGIPETVTVTYYMDVDKALKLQAFNFVVSYDPKYLRFDPDINGEYDEDLEEYDLIGMLPVSNGVGDVNPKPEENLIKFAVAKWDGLNLKKSGDLIPIVKVIFSVVKGAKGMTTIDAKCSACSLTNPKTEEDYIIYNVNGLQQEAYDFVTGGDPATIYTVIEPAEEPTTEPVPTSFPQLEGEGTSSNPYKINSADDWNHLAECVAAGEKTDDLYFTLSNSITVSTSVGTQEHPFAGTFNGAGETLTLALQDEGYFCSPFAFVSGATVRNLKTDGTVNGGMHCSGLVGCAMGDDNLIEKCTVSANITCSLSHCGGILGHGSTYKTTIKDCIFDGNITGADYAGTLWGWSDNGSTPVLMDCIDFSETAYPVGMGDPRNPSLSNVYYTFPNKVNQTRRPWNNIGSQAFNVCGDGVALMLAGSLGGIQLEDGTIYAAEGESVRLSVFDDNMLYTADNGRLEQNGNILLLTMPAADVTIGTSDAPYVNGCTLIEGTQGNKDEGPEKLVDGIIAVKNKWCVSSGKYPMSMTFKTEKAFNLKGYVLTTGGDSVKYPERNPISWTLEGSTDGNNWTVLTDTNGNRTLGAKNCSSYFFTLTAPNENYYSYFRFTVKETAGQKTFQLSELRLLGEEEPYKYGLWLGSTQVNTKNKDDILGDGGKAKFDPVTNTLTLNEPTITGTNPYTDLSCKIFCRDTGITIKGSYHMTEADNCGYAVYAQSCGLMLDGDFAFRATSIDILSDKGLTVASGKLYAHCSRNTSLYICGNISFGDKLERAEIVCDGTEPAIICSGGVTLSDKLMYFEPENGDLNEAKRVLISRKPDLGDVNLDGVVDVSDATVIQMASADLTTLSELQKSVADVNSDGVIDINDATYIQMYAAELINEFPKAN